MNMATIGLIVSMIVALTGGLAGISSWWTGKAQARKFNTEASLLADRAKVDAAEILSNTAAGLGTAAEAMIKPLTAQLATLTEKLTSAERRIGDLTAELGTAHTEIGKLRTELAAARGQVAT